MNIWVLVALIVVLILVWLVVTRPSAPGPAETLGAELIGPRLQERQSKRCPSN